MKFINKIILSAALSVLTFGMSIAQVGVGTSTPEGMLDLQNNNSTGFIFPRVALTSNIIAAPVTNPDGGALVAGTVVFNTNTTSRGTNDVYPGIYAWDGSRWNPQYLREDSAIFEQSTLSFRVANDDSYVDVPGLGNGSSFTAKYSGTYRIKANFNFGAGEVRNPASGYDIRMATQEGYFRFTFSGTSHLIYTHSYSVSNDDIGSPRTRYDQFRHDTSLILYETLAAGQTYNFRLEIDLFVSSDFINNGNSGNGRSYVGLGIPCTVEFTYLEE
tara:strand:+ start:27739 stop:28557 length:819 start_codon:yes stop_codon:yes gene_type:complete